MINRFVVSAALLLVLAGTARADEPVCVVIHQEGFIRNATPQQVDFATGNAPDHLIHGMIVPCTDEGAALNWYLAHGGH